MALSTHKLKRQIWPASEFVTPRSLEESASRLRAQNGKYDDVEISVQLQPIDDDRYQFYMNTRRPGSDESSLEVTGHLSRQDARSTVVTIKKSRINFNAYVLAFAILAVAFIGAVRSESLPAIGAFIIAASISWYLNRRRGNDLVCLIRETLSR
jgi:hypothetical protein